MRDSKWPLNTPLRAGTVFSALSSLLPESGIGTEY